jgi:hypothetical protein
LAHKKLTPVRPESIDTTNTDPKYWEDILKREGLSMNRGMFPHAYVGGSEEIDQIAGSSSQVSQSRLLAIADAKDK